MIGNPEAVPRTGAAIEAGEALPPFTVSLTLQRLAMEAGANRDFSLIHLDPEVGRESGAPTAFANTTLVETMLEAGIRGWAGPTARILELEFTMSDFTCAGEVVSTGGTVTGVLTEDGGWQAEVDLWISGSERGRTVTGSAKLSFPSEPTFAQDLP